MCENGKPVPLEKEDFKEWARALTEVGKTTLVAARARDREAVSHLTNRVAGACEDCHSKYRFYQDRCRQ
jgi:cytochrome c556